MKPKITIHSFSNGAAIFNWGGDIDPKQFEQFRAMWTEAWEKSRRLKQRPVFSIGGTDVEVVIHANPLGEEPFDFDALSHAFGSLGWEVEDEQIEAFIDGLRSYYS